MREPRFHGSLLVTTVMMFAVLRRRLDALSVTAVAAIVRNRACRERFSYCDSYHEYVGSELIGGVPICNVTSRNDVNSILRRSPM